jgi:putative ABC transport system ATP-binding protein
MRAIKIFAHLGCSPLSSLLEPTSALDRQTRQEVTELMTTLAKEQGSAVLIVTHDSRIFGSSDRSY